MKIQKDQEKSTRLEIENKKRYSGRATYWNCVKIQSRAEKIDESMHVVQGLGNKLKQEMLEYKIKAQKAYLHSAPRFKTRGGRILHVRTLQNKGEEPVSRNRDPVEGKQILNT